MELLSRSDWSPGHLTRPHKAKPNRTPRWTVDSGSWLEQGYGPDQLQYPPQFKGYSFTSRLPVGKRAALPVHTHTHTLSGPFLTFTCC